MTFDAEGFDVGSAPPGAHIYNEDGKAVARNTIKARLDRTWRHGNYSKKNGFIAKTSKGSVSISKSNAERTWFNVIDKDLLTHYSIWMGRDQNITVDHWLTLASDELGVQGVENILREIAKDPLKEEAAKIKAINKLFDLELTRRTIVDDPTILKIRSEYEAAVAIAQAKAAEVKMLKNIKEEMKSISLLDPGKERQRRWQDVTGLLHWDEIGGQFFLDRWESDKDFLYRRWKLTKDYTCAAEVKDPEEQFYLMWILDPTDEELEKLEARLMFSRTERQEQMKAYGIWKAEYDGKNLLSHDWQDKPYVRHPVHEVTDSSIREWLNTMSVYESIDHDVVLARLGAYRRQKYGWEIKRINPKYKRRRGCRNTDR